MSSLLSRPLSLVMVILFFLPRRLVLRRHVEDAVGVDVEGHVDLGHTTGRGGMPSSSNLPSRWLSRVMRALALEHLNEHAGLVVGVGREDLAPSSQGWWSCAR